MDSPSTKYDLFHGRDACKQVKEETNKKVNLFLEMRRMFTSTNLKVTEGTTVEESKLLFET